jgi:hypothetical protein
MWKLIVYRTRNLVCIMYNSWDICTHISHHTGISGGTRSLHCLLACSRTSRPLKCCKWWLSVYVFSRALHHSIALELSLNSTGTSRLVTICTVHEYFRVSFICAGISQATGSLHSLLVCFRALHYFGICEWRLETLQLSCMLIIFDTAHGSHVSQNAI